MEVAGVESTDFAGMALGVLSKDHLTEIRFFRLRPYSAQIATRTRGGRT